LASFTEGPVKQSFNRWRQTPYD